MPGELEDHMADADENGPWWEARGDYVTARHSQMQAAARGIESSLADHVIDWNPRPVELWNWDQASKLLDGLVAATRN